MPSRAFPLWMLTGALIIGRPVVSFIYWPLALQSGALPADADSIAIPMISDVVATILISPIVLGVAILCLRRYNPKTRLATWRRDRPVRSTVATVALGGPAAALVTVIIIDVRADWPWYEHLWTGYGLLLISWLLALRAAVIERLDLEAA
jgi:hypothetical protein